MSLDLDKKKNSSILQPPIKKKLSTRQEKIDKTLRDIEKLQKKIKENDEKYLGEKHLQQIFNPKQSKFHTKFDNEMNSKNPSKRIKRLMNTQVTPGKWSTFEKGRQR